MAKSKKTFIDSYATNQFFNFTSIGEPPLARASYDNPEFLWPSKEYTDITGTTHKVQRGYMRSLVTDPNLSPISGTKNRRLFFQFNPQVLVRSVQQTPGAMNPLLQDPAQLTMPVPGTASFGFELFFNREHEVNSGVVSNEEGFPLEGDNIALVSKVGVLADLMVLDTITGQGLSSDMQKILSNRIFQQETNRVALNAETSEDTDNPESAKSYKPQEVPDIDAINKMLQTNIGNTAFLNPLPFRVIFSSLFMVEGIANSIDVTFQKFSRTMVPTQCRVVINMYALYIGFAKKQTFLYNNLQNATQETIRTTTSDAVTKSYLDRGLKRILIERFSINGNPPNMRILDTKSDPFIRQIKNKQVSDVRIKVRALFDASSSDVIMETANLQYSADFTYKDDLEIPIEKLSAGEDLKSTIMKDILSNISSTNRYVTIQFEFQLIGKGETGNKVESDIVGSPRYKVDRESALGSYQITNQVLENPKQYPTSRTMFK